jgi:hypothetical protein
VTRLVTLVPNGRECVGSGDGFYAPIVTEQGVGAGPAVDDARDTLA